mgnify:CR=1 FL=1
MIESLKLAYFPEKMHSINRQRHCMLATKKNFEIVDDKYIFANIHEIHDLLISDDIELKVLFKLFFNTFKNKKFNIEIIFLELYTISIQTIWNELQTRLSLNPTNYFTNGKILYNSTKWVSKYLVFTLLLKRFSVTLYLPSYPRILFLRNKLANTHQFKLLRNLPILSLFNKEISENVHQGLNYITREPFFYLPGSINNYNDLLKVCQYAFKNSIKVVITTKEKNVKRKCKHFPECLMITAELTYSEIIYLVIKSRAGIIIYSSENINQNLEASSKLYEFLMLNKPIIASRVKGMEYDRNLNIDKRFHFIDKLENIDITNFENIHCELDTSLSFENQLLNIR